MKFRATNEARFNRDLDRAFKAFVSEARTAQRETAEAILEGANPPKDTGELAESGKVVELPPSPRRSVVQVVYTAPHATFVHFAVSQQFRTGEALFLERSIQRNRATLQTKTRDRWRSIR